MYALLFSSIVANDTLGETGLPRFRYTQYKALGCWFRVRKLEFRIRGVGFRAVIPNVAANPLCRILLRNALRTYGIRLYRLFAAQQNPKSQTITHLAVPVSAFTCQGSYSQRCHRAVEGNFRS